MRDRDGGKLGADLTVKLINEREIVRSSLFESPRVEGKRRLASEQERQVTRRVLRNCAAQAQSAAIGTAR
jgi:hypothetical protein